MTMYLQPCKAVNMTSYSRLSKSHLPKSGHHNPWMSQLPQCATTKGSCCISRQDLLMPGQHKHTYSLQRSTVKLLLTTLLYFCAANKEAAWVQTLNRHDC